ncbi:MAG: hypothetical protein L6Q92_01860 [Phycisphaerae bacterium]|nr:hypothetical protein [Phycisphaerae bacterium]
MMAGGYSLWLPVDVSKHGFEIDRLIYALHILMAVLFVGWGIVFAYCLVRFRQRPGHRADAVVIKAKASKYAEIGVAVFEAVLLLAFAVPVLARVKNQFPSEAESEVVRVVAEQFAWNGHYAGADGVFGRTDPKFIAPDNLIGLDPNDPHGTDDIITVNELHVPVNKPVIVRLSSKDVIHSFAVPALRVKQDVIPGMTIPIWFEAARLGEFDIQCAQLCGNNHFKMRGRIHIDTDAAFAEWKKSKAPGEAPKVSEEDFQL